MASVMTEANDMNRYKRLEKLGEGTYGLVYKARDLETNEIVAIKKIKLDNNEEGIPATTMREISLLNHLKHPNIVEMHCCLCVNGELYLVFEYMACDLKGYIDDYAKTRYMDSITLKKFTYYLTEGIRYCHARRILHRDLKPQNILVSNTGKLKIADFGLGREHGLPIGQLTHEVVTLWYRPPEILLGQEAYSGACDVWGIACIVAEMATKVPLFAGDSEIDQLFQIYRILGTPNETIWPGISKLPQYKPVGPQWRRKDLWREVDMRMDKTGIELLSAMLTYAPNKRICAKHALAHAWFDEIREDMIQEFGNTYPHCGSKAYQQQMYKKKAHRSDENKDSSNNMRRGKKRRRLDEDGLPIKHQSRKPKLHHHSHQDEHKIENIEDGDKARQCDEEQRYDVGKRKLRKQGREVKEDDYYDEHVHHSDSNNNNHGLQDQEGQEDEEKDKHGERDSEQDDQDEDEDCKAPPDEELTVNAEEWCDEDGIRRDRFSQPMDVEDK